MPNHVESVKKAAAVFRRSAENQRDKNPPLASEREADADRLEQAADRLIELEGLTSALPPDLGNIHDLPQELLEELSISKTDELEDQIVTVINAYGGTASLDQILVGLYRKFKVSQKRRFIQNKLYRMTCVWSVDGKKGVYTTSEPEEAPEEEADWQHLVSEKKDDFDSEIPF